MNQFPAIRRTANCSLQEDERLLELRGAQKESAPQPLDRPEALTTKANANALDTGALPFARAVICHQHELKPELVPRLKDGRRSRF